MRSKSYPKTSVRLHLAGKCHPQRSTIFILKSVAIIKVNSTFATWPRIDLEGKGSFRYFVGILNQWLIRQNRSRADINRQVG